jgi:hypothetical protein
VKIFGNFARISGGPKKVSFLWGGDVIWVSLLPLCNDDRADSDLQMGGVLWFDVFRPYYGLMFVDPTMV